MYTYIWKRKKGEFNGCFLKITSLFSYHLSAYQLEISYSPVYSLWIQNFNMLLLLFINVKFFGVNKYELNMIVTTPLLSILTIEH